MIKIEKGLPMPKKHGGRAPKYPFARLKKGESFLFPKHIKMASASRTCYYWGKKFSGQRFQVRTTPKGVRAWRTA